MCILCILQDDEKGRGGGFGAYTEHEIVSGGAWCVCLLQLTSSETDSEQFLLDLCYAFLFMESVCGLVKGGERSKGGSAPLSPFSGSSPTRGSSFFLGKVTALGVLCCCFALFVCLTLLASFFLPSHLSFKNMYNVHVCTCTCFNERCRRKEERSKQGQTNNKANQHSTPKAVTFPKNNELPCTCV